MNESQHIRQRFELLQKGLLRNFKWDEGNLNFHIWLPEMAGKRNSAFTFFYATLTACRRFGFQPFPNSGMVVDSLSELEQLGLSLGQPLPGRGRAVMLKCRSQKFPEPGWLHISAEDLKVYDEAFDRIELKELENMRGETQA